MFTTLKAKFIISFIAIEVIFFAIVVAINFTSLDKASSSLIDEKNEISIHLLGKLVKTAIITYDLATIDDAVASFSTLKNVLAVGIKSADDIVLSMYIKDDGLKKKEFQSIIKNSEKVNSYKNESYLYESTSIEEDGIELGSVHILFDTSENLYTLEHNKELTYQIIFLALLVGFIVAYVIGNSLGRSLKQLTVIAKNVSSGQEVRIPHKKNRTDELGVLFNSMFEMQNIINSRTKELKESINDLEQFADALDSSAIVSKTDVDGKIIYVNEKFLQTTGYTEEEVLGKTHSFLRDPDEADSFFKEMWETISSQNIFHAVFKNINKSGEPYYVDATIVPLLNSKHEIEQYMAIRYEVTDIVNARNSAIEAKRLKESFLANMSHEIRTPLNAILGFTDILKKNVVDETNKNHLNVIQNSSKSLLNIINDILDFSKIESGKLEINKYNYNPYKDFNAAVDLFKVNAEIKSIEMNVEFSDNVPKCLNGDILRIKQVLSNFLSNALKFTDSGKKIIILIDYTVSNSILSISVKDEGIGISESAQEKIFLEFEQADSSTTRKFGGTGLGLAISLRLVKLMDGDIEIESKEGEGSTFRCLIPSIVCDRVDDIYDEGQTTDETVQRALKGHILVAEDNKTNQMLIKLLLEDYDLTYEIANDGLEAVELFKKKSFDLVLMDESMPNMKGSEAFVEIRKHELRGFHIPVPIVALTANVMQEDKMKFLELGMNDFLAKPIENRELERVLDKYLN